MKNRYWIGLVFSFLAIFTAPARPQTWSTTLSLTAHWDDNTYVAGKVTIAAVHLIGADTVIATKMLSYGAASLSLVLASNSIYHVTLYSPTGTQLVKFPVTTALINPQSLQSGGMKLVFRKADQSLKSANIDVAMQF